MIRASLAKFAIGALPLLLAPVAAFAQDDDDKPFDRTPVDCVRVTLIDRTEAVDDQNILFHMRGDTVYRNHLPRRCPRLEHENRIAYKVYSGRLCDSDTVTVLEQGAFGLQQGFTCSLGDFVPLSPEEVEDLRRQEDDLPANADAVQTEAVELDREADDAADEESDSSERAESPTANE
jgi:hypothetical protein